MAGNSHEKSEVLDAEAVFFAERAEGEALGVLGNSGILLGEIKKPLKVLAWERHCYNVYY